MKNTKIITVSLAAALAIVAITANGVLVSADAEKGTIKVAASATPHAEILEEAKPILEIVQVWDMLEIVRIKISALYYKVWLYIIIKYRNFQIPSFFLEDWFCFFQNL